MNENVKESNVKLSNEICPWARDNEVNRLYHDNEWGVPSFDDVHLFEMLILEGAQAGLSWITILKRRESYKKAYMNFDPNKVSKFDEDYVEFLLSDKSGIIKNKLKVLSSINNAKLFLDIQKEYGSFANFLWGFVDFKPIVNNLKEQSEMQVTSPLSDEISKTLYKKGFRFVGSTIIYSYLQAVGIINDHIVTCPFHSKIVNEYSENKFINKTGLK